MLLDSQQHAGAVAWAGQGEPGRPISPSQPTLAAADSCSVSMQHTEPGAAAWLGQLMSVLRTFQTLSFVTATALATQLHACANSPLVPSSCPAASMPFRSLALSARRAQQPRRMLQHTAFCYTAAPAQASKPFSPSACCSTLHIHSTSAQRMPQSTTVPDHSSPSAC